MPGLGPRSDDASARRAGVPDPGRPILARIRIEIDLQDLQEWQPPPLPDDPDEEAWIQAVIAAGPPEENPCD